MPSKMIVAFVIDSGSKPVSNGNLRLSPEIDDETTVTAAKLPVRRTAQQSRPTPLLTTTRVDHQGIQIRESLPGTYLAA